MLITTVLGCFLLYNGFVEYSNFYTNHIDYSHHEENGNIVIDKIENHVSNQHGKTHIRKKVIHHVNSVVAVQQNKKGVVAVYRAAVDLLRRHRAQGGQLAQIVTAGHGSVREEHVQVKHRLEEEKQDAPPPLAAGAAAKAHDEVGQSGLPVPVFESKNQGFKPVSKAEEEPGDALAQPF